MRKLVAGLTSPALELAVDVHCPWIRGAHNDVIYMVGSADPRIASQQQQLGQLLEAGCQGPLPYKLSDNIPFGTAWNTAGNFRQGTSFSRWAGSLPGIRLATSFEIPYASAGGQEVNAQSARAFGRDLARALFQYLKVDGQYAHPEMLLEPTELAKPAVAEQFIVLDARPRDQYEKQHVPAARHVDHDAWKKAYADGQDMDGWSQRIGQLGISAHSEVVVYDDIGMKDAARIWWILKFCGVERVRLLNGGWRGWQLAHLPTTDQPPTVTARSFQAKPNEKRLATIDQMLNWLPNHEVQVVDARSDDEFCGIDKRDNQRGGAIPDAKHLEWNTIIDSDTGRFRSPEQITKLFQQAGIDLALPTASHCDGGGRAAVMAFGLELMGAERVRNYYRGWGEWGNRTDTPVSVPPSGK